MLTPLQRLLLILGAALLLPIVAVLTLLASQTFADRSRSVETEALANADRISAAADGRIQADLAALAVFATSPALLRSDWTASERRAETLVQTLPGWKALVLRRGAEGSEVFRAGRGGASEAPLGWPLPAPGQTQAVVSGATRTGYGCPCIFLHMPVAGRPDLLLTVAVDPAVIQQMVVQKVPPGRVAGVMDRNGAFIARTLDYEARLGTLATRYVREAIARGGTGVYAGTTFEGMKNYTAYTTSDLTGWSAHVALDRSLIDGPGRRAGLVATLGALISLIVAAALVAYVVHDLMIRRREEQAVLHLQKAEAIGRFASSVAHDFNNLLHVVIGNLDRLMNGAADADTRRRAGLAMQAAQRGAKLANQLLSFARHDGAEIQGVDLAEVLAGMDDLLQESVGPSVRLSLDVDPQARHVFINPDQLELALINLAVNARDAMAGAGALRISTQAAGERVELQVADTGPGVPDALRPRMFEPFFTTKPPGQGTGLGLAQVAGAARQAGGHAEVRRAAEGGALFVLSLRRAPAPASASADRAAPAEDALQG